MTVDVFYHYLLSRSAAILRYGRQVGVSSVGAVTAGANKRFSSCKVIDEANPMTKTKLVSGFHWAGGSLNTEYSLTLRVRTSTRQV